MITYTSMLPSVPLTLASRFHPTLYLDLLLVTPPSSSPSSLQLTLTLFLPTQKCPPPAPSFSHSTTSSSSSSFHPSFLHGPSLTLYEKSQVYVPFLSFRPLPLTSFHSAGIIFFRHSFLGFLSPSPASQMLVFGHFPVSISTGLITHCNEALIPSLNAVTLFSMYNIYVFLFSAVLALRITNIQLALKT